MSTSLLAVLSVLFKMNIENGEKYFVDYYEPNGDQYHQNFLAVQMYEDVVQFVADGRPETDGYLISFQLEENIVWCDDLNLLEVLDAGRIEVSPSVNTENNN